MAYDDSGTKYIRVDKLRALLATLPDEIEVEPNCVGNLLLYGGPGNWLGFIDLNHEVVHFLEEGNHVT